jgi:endonuclease YncB( thermonuclease family)
MNRSRYAFFIASLLIASEILFISSGPASAALKVAKVYDGDTIIMSDGLKVRLLQIDTPELASKECYGQEAKVELIKLLARKGAITLKSDPVSASFDRYGRALRYIFIGKLNVNLELVKLGAAAPYFYQGEKGIYSAQLLKAAQDAQYYKVGLWKVCPGTKLTPTKAVSTFQAVPTPVIAPTPSTPLTGSNSVSGCDPNYGGCIPMFPPDLNCSDLKILGLTPVTVIGKDPHRLDSDGDGKGCTG